MKPQVNRLLGECCQVTESGVTEPGLQAGSSLHAALTCGVIPHGGSGRAHSGHVRLRPAEGVVERVTGTPVASGTG